MEAVPELAIGGKGALNLLMSTVRAERSDSAALRFGLTVTSLDDKFELQCESEPEREEWITALQASGTVAFQVTVEADSTPRKPLHDKSYYLL